MCWNADVSMNTFLFACFALLFIYLTHTYSKYKTPTFNNPLVYVYLFVVASMQLLEFFLWRNLHKTSINNLVSKIVTVNITFQPLILMCMIESSMIRYAMIGIYSLFILLYRWYKDLYHPFYFHTSIYKGHLKWDWTDAKDFEKGMHFIYLAIYISSFLLIRNTLLTFFGLLSMFLTFYLYFKDGTFGSMWCWFLNVFLLYFIVNILLVKPFLEYNGLC